MSYKTSYRVKWEESFLWLIAVKSDKHNTHGKLCCKGLKTNGGGISQIKAHPKSNKGQRTFTSSSNLYLSKSSDIALTSEEQVEKAQIIELIKTVSYNYFFSSVDGGKKRF